MAKAKDDKATNAREEDKPTIPSLLARVCDSVTVIASRLKEIRDMPEKSRAAGFRPAADCAVRAASWFMAALECLRSVTGLNLSNWHEAANALDDVQPDKEEDGFDPRQVPDMRPDAKGGV